MVELNAEEGEVVGSGMMNDPATKIATVADLSELLAELDVDENEIVDVVFVVADGVAQRRRVETGPSTVTRVEIVAGVEEGEPVRLAEDDDEEDED